MDLFRWKKYHIEHVSEIFEIIFKMRQKYSSRLEFTVEQYLNRSIPYNLKTFRLTIFRFVTIWTTIIILLSTILVPGFDKFISIKRLEETHHVNRLDLIYIYSVLMVISWENLSLIEFKNVIRYRNPSNEIIIHFIQFDFDRKIPKQIQNDLIKNFIKQSYIFGTIYRLICYSTFFYRLTNDFCMILLKESELDRLVANAVFILLSILNLTLISGILFVMMFCFVFVIRFLCLRLWLLMDKIKTFTSRSERIQIGTRNKYRLLDLIHREYNQINFEIHRFNSSAKDHFLLFETISKTGCVFWLVFNHFQYTTNMYSIYAAIICVQTFLLVNFLSLQVTKIPAMNFFCFKSFSDWNARLQFRHKNFIRNRRQNFSMSNLRSNLFIQSISECPIGFTCGPLFRITKSKHLETFVWTFILILLFYQKLLNLLKFDMNPM